MMKTKLYFLLCLAMIICGCSTEQVTDLDKWREEIRNAENDFRDMAREKGLAEAFEHYAASDAVMHRNGMLIKGKDSIGLYTRERVKGEVSLDWEPAFIEVSASGDLGYTYGNFTYVSVDSLGKRTESSGVFHTVWKRQKDGNWKYVWD